MVVPTCGAGLQPSALTHWSMPSMTDRRSFGLAFGVPLYLAMGSLTLWNSMVGTARVGWIVGISTCPETEEMAAKWSDASSAMAYAIIPPLEIPVIYTLRRFTGVRAAMSEITLRRNPTSLMCLVTGRPQHSPAFQPYCAFLATGSGVSTLEIRVPSGYATR